MGRAKDLSLEEIGQLKAYFQDYTLSNRKIARLMSRSLDCINAHRKNGKMASR